jgi:hypothetical protein
MGQLVSAAGVQQGDPLGPLIFALALHRLILELNNIDGLLVHFWYLDDGILCGSAKATKACLDSITAATEWSGLELHMGKFHLHSRGDLSRFPKDAKKFHHPNIEILGAPVGDSQFCETHIKKKQLEAEKLLDELSRLQDPQISLLLLRQCGSFCKLAHIARCCPPDQVSAQLAVFDDAVMRCLEESTGIELSGQARLQAQLPLSEGGMGLRSLQRHAPAAYISSVVSVQATASGMETAVALYNTKVHPDNNIDPESLPTRCKSQSSLSMAVDKSDWNDLYV